MADGYQNFEGYYVKEFDYGKVAFNLKQQNVTLALNNETTYGSTTISMIDKEIVGGYVTRGTQKIEIDPRIAEFNSNKDTIFLDFFKYDFGSAIKSLNLHD